MNKDSSNPNLEWKKTGFESKETVTRKTNVKKALEYEAKEKNSVQNLFSTLPAELPKGLKKIRKKIKDSFDEDDEDENEFVDSTHLTGNSLLNALHDDEKKNLKQQENINNTKMLQDAGKLEALAIADKMAKEFGLKGLKKETINKNTNDVSINPKIGDVLGNDIAKKMKIKDGNSGQWKNLSEKDLVNVLRGVKRIQAIGGEKAVEGMKINEVISLGSKKDAEKEIAEKILEKSGRIESKEEKAKKEKDLRNKSKNKEKPSSLAKALSR